MKNLILLLLSILFACSSDKKDPAPIVTTDQALKVHYQNFLDLASSHGKVVTKTAVIKLGDCDCQKNGVWYVQDKTPIEFYAYHALGHALLGRPDTNVFSIMNLGAVDYYLSKEQQFIDELFAN